MTKSVSEQFRTQLQSYRERLDIRASEVQFMKLYQFPLSPNSMKVLALAYEVGLAIETKSLNVLKGETRTPEMLAKNPNGKVPILEDGDFVLWESNAMLGYLAAKAERKDLAPHAPREAMVKKGTEEFATVARVLDASLERREYLCGRLTIADFALITHAMVLDDCGLDLSPYPSAVAWRQRVLARPSVRRAMTEARAAV